MNRDKVAYVQGMEAKRNGWERKSPYTNCTAENAWYAGYDEQTVRDENFEYAAYGSPHSLHQPAYNEGPG